MTMVADEHRIPSAVVLADEATGRGRRMTAHFALPLNGAAAVFALPLASEIAAAEAVYAERCEARALLYMAGEISRHDAVDELQVYAEQSGLIDRIGQDEAQRLMREAFAAVDLLRDDEAFEREIFLRTAELVERWEIADPRDRWQHTGEAPPKVSAAPPRGEPYRPAESTIAAFWYVATREPEKLKAWLARHPDDAPALHKIWKAKQ
jgi:hypothetical protein